MWEPGLLSTVCSSTDCCGGNALLCFTDGRRNVTDLKDIQEGIAEGRVVNVPALYFGDFVLLSLSEGQLDV
jgi:hypothetical protein